MFNATFETIFGKKFCLGAAQGAPKVKKRVFGKNTKWPPAAWFVIKFFWSKNKSFPFWEDSAGVQNLEPFWPKMAKFWPFFHFCHFQKIGNLAFFTVQQNFLKWGQRSPMTKILTFSSQTQLSIGMGTCGENFGPLPCPMAILGPQKVSGRIQPPPLGTANLPTTRD